MLTSDELQALRLSMQAALVGTGLGMPVAIIVGWMLVKKSFRGKAVLDMFVSFPLVLPPIITGYFLLVMLGPNGPIGRLLDYLFGIDLVFTWIAAGLAAGS